MVSSIQVDGGETRSHGITLWNRFLLNLSCFGGYEKELHFIIEVKSANLYILAR